MPHVVRAFLAPGETSTHQVVMPGYEIVHVSDSGKETVVAFVGGVEGEDADSRARKMADALDGKFSFVMKDWRVGEDESHDDLSKEAIEPRVVTLDTSGGGVFLRVRPEGEPSVYDMDEADPRSNASSDVGCRQISVGMEMDAGAFRLMIAHEADDNYATVAIGPKGVYIRNDRNHTSLLFRQDALAREITGAIVHDGADNDHREEIAAPLPGGVDLAPGA